jgi:anti-sigma regulatory factor (Ser/Thr protein kinase)
VSGSFNLRVSCRAQSLREVRAAVDTLVSIDPKIRETLKLVLSELLANAVTHSGLDESASIEVSVHSDGERARVDVRDKGVGFALPSNGEWFPHPAVVVDVGESD